MCINELLVYSTASKYIKLFFHYIYSGRNRQLAPLCPSTLPLDVRTLRSDPEPAERDHLYRPLSSNQGNLCMNVAVGGQ